MKQTLKAKAEKAQSERVIKGFNERVRGIEAAEFNRGKYYMGVPAETTDIRITDLARDDVGDVFKRNKNNTGWQEFAAGSGLTITYDAAWTEKADLGNPQEFAIGYLDSGAGTDQGFWIYPPDGSDNDAWRPLPAYN